MNENKTTEITHSAKAATILLQINSKTMMASYEKSPKKSKKITNLRWNYGQQRNSCRGY